MQKEWKAFRVTLLLYFSILIISLSFYQVVISFNEIQKDTKMVKKIVLTNNTIEQFSCSKSAKEKQALIKNIDIEIKKLKTLFSEKNLHQIDIRASESFSQLLSCWDIRKKSFLKGEEVSTTSKDYQSCNSKIKLSIFIIEETLEVKQNKMMNKLYLSFLILIITMLLLIYTVRAYIHYQIKKHAIHDYETKLFNKNYFLSQLKTSCARSVRYKYPLSILSISIDDFREGTKRYDEKTKEHILGMLGGLITSMTRTSDVACRYDEDHFSILLPDTEEENALILEKRVREVFEKHDFMAKPELKFKFSTVPFNYEETPEAFITRTEGLLK